MMILLMSMIISFLQQKLTAIEALKAGKGETRVWLPSHERVAGRWSQLHVFFAFNAAFTLVRRRFIQLSTSGMAVAS